MTASSVAVSAAPRSKGLLTPADPGSPVSIRRVWPGDAAARVVRHYWFPRWTLPAGARLRQDVLEYPTANLVIEPDVAMLYRARRGRSTRILTGDGWAFGAMLHPGAARGMISASVRSMPAALDLADLPLTGTGPMAARIRDRMRASDDDGAIAAFEEWLGSAVAAPGPDAMLVDEIVDAVENDRELVRVEQLAARFDLGVRRLQRLVSGHIGFGPKWLIQRYRLQEAAAALRSDDPPSLAALAAALGYADQAHFGREFKAVIGQTPGSYQAAVA